MTDETLWSLKGHCENPTVSKKKKEKKKAADRLIMKRRDSISGWIIPASKGEGKRKMHIEDAAPVKSGGERLPFLKAKVGN